MMRDLALGLRLAVGGGRMSGAALLRLAMTTLGIALAVAVLLPAAAVHHLMGVQAERRAAISQVTEPRAGVAPLLAYNWYASAGDDFVKITAVAATGANSPVPPGLGRLPAPGELAVSPELAAKLAAPGGSSLKAQLPGHVAGRISREGVAGAGDLSAFYGVPAAQIEAEADGRKVYAFGLPYTGLGLSAIVLGVILPIAAVLLLPLLIFVTTASRMGAAQRERRLAALRLIGLDSRQVKRVAAAESLVGAVLGLAAGIGFFAVLRTFVADVLPFGLRIFPEDFVPSWPLVVVIVLLVPGLAVGSALFGLRRTIVEPLGVVRQGKPVRRRMWWRWALTAVGALLLAATLAFGRGNGHAAAGLTLAAGSVFLLVGVAALLPWLVERLVERLHGGPPSWQLAIRRLQLDSGTASRVVSGLVVVLAGTILIQGVITSLDSGTARQATPDGVAAAPVRVDTTVAHEAEVGKLVSAVPGVTGVHPARNLTFRSGQERSYGVVGDCVALRAQANIGDCSDGDVFSLASDSGGAAPAGKLQLQGYSRGREVNGPEWTVPAGVKVVPAAYAGTAMGDSLLVTPGALGGLALPDSSVAVYVSGTGDVQALTDNVARAVSPLAWNASAGKTDYLEDFRARDRQLVESFRAVLITASLFVLAVAAMSLLMLSIEQISERRRPLAALSAAGVPIGVLARGALWQTGIPVVVGVVLAVAAGLGLTAPILRLADRPMIVDVPVLLALAGATVAAVLLVTGLTMPLLRQVTRLDTLRSE
ncbi:FtsX-like permease family protein [Amycolatopsis australiensis]|uniref:FtsX-like permease family protein n=1 Tax=Amycolatopsis australiensis TaxID=546364 RepID=A0A1K1RYH9_9PSEU|nr:FtsX-like permease family protein [Amycolatopsis australiensis]SFW77216.1 FtsX-like permease family protein [Amycolatopsis australiensis]